ncbi:MAG: hypothetical protein IPP70_02920 [Elusimicrobia bacterium]|nr:hypothetical protein [Elusimicrobiota bacterium]
MPGPSPFLPRLLRIVAVALVAAAGAVHADTLIPPGKYEETALAAVRSAKRSVHLFLYLFNLPAGRASGPGRLAEALIDARRRGVEVDVLLDAGDSPFDPLDRNRAAVEALARGGVAVAYVDGKILHAKAVVVDRKTVILGSSNWTSAAFESNVEADVVMTSTAAAEGLLARMAAVPRRAPPGTTAERRVAVPADFLSPSAVGAMVRRKDEGGLDLYLHFLRVGLSTQAFTEVDVPRAVAALGYKDQGSVANRRRLHKIFRRLDQYGLVEAKETYGRDPAVRARPARSTATVALSDHYFVWGWDRRLPLAGKVFALLSQHYAERSPAGPRWSQSQATLAERHGLTEWFLSRGVVTLRRENLVDVDYDDQPTATDRQRRPSVYTPGAFYDPAAMDRVMGELETRHGADALRRARALARMLYEDNDPRVVEKLIALENRHGRAVMAEAARLLGQKKPDNPKRQYAYFAGVARGLAGGAGADGNAP